MKNADPAATTPHLAKDPKAPGSRIAWGLRYRAPEHLDAVQDRMLGIQVDHREDLMGQGPRAAPAGSP